MRVTQKVVSMTMRRNYTNILSEIRHTVSFVFVLFFVFVFVFVFVFTELDTFTLNN